MGEGNFTLTGYRDGGTVPNPHGGQLARYYCNFTGPDATAYSDVYWSRKPESPVEVGGVYYGEMTSSDKGYRFRTKQNPNGAAPNVQAPPAQTNGQAQTPPQPRPQAAGSRDSRIERQHSQGEATAFLIATGNLNGLNLDNEAVIKALLEKHRRLTDYFQRDIARQAGTPTQPAPPAQHPAAQPPPQPAVIAGDHGEPVYDEDGIPF